MKKIFLGAIVISMLLSGCKVFQSMEKSEPVQEQPQTKVFSTQPTETTRENPSSDVMYEETDAPVRTQEESFTFEQRDDATKYAGSSFFVIIGSFSSSDNANRYKEELTPQGFAPIILHSETGYYRVCVGSFTEETAARQRVHQIRNDFPKYYDTWLLIKK